MKLFFILLICLCLVNGFACKNGITQSNTSNNILSLLDAGSTEAWVNVKTSSLGYPIQGISIKQDHRVLLTVSLPHPDTVLYVDSLTPSHSFRLVVDRISSFGLIDSSESFMLTTIDTTSHNIIWHIDTLGDGNSSMFNDVAIVNDTVVYAAGIVYKKDSLGNWITYNLAKWNGIYWQLEVVPVLVCGTNYTGPFQLYCVFNVTFDNSWFSGGAEIEHWNGNSFSHDCSMNSLLNGQLTKIWASSSENVYAVGLSGTIIYFNGNLWQKLESISSGDIYDAWGIVDPVLQKEEIYCASSTVSQPSRILKILDNKVDTVSWNPAINVYSVWSDKGYTWYACGTGLFKSKQGTWQAVDLGGNYNPNAVRGTNLNDIFLAGPYGFIAHYNGNSWKLFTESPSAIFYTLSVSKNIIVAVGFINDKAIAVIGRR